VTGLPRAAPEPAVKSYFRTPHRRQTDIDISSVSFWSRGFDERDQAFARLRTEAPVSWHPPLETPGLPKRSREAGFWAVTKAADIAFVSRHHDLFSSEIGKVNVRPTPFRTIPNMLVLDPPLHTAYRRIVSGAFTPRAIATLTTTIDRRARQIVLRAAQRREFDFVSAISAQLPLRTVADLIGVPAGEHERFVLAADSYVRTRVPAQLPSGTNPEAFIAEQGRYLTELCTVLAAMRRRQPADDLMTRLVQADIGGAPLGDDAILSTVLLLIVAGDDTTKQATTLSYLALRAFPAELQWLQEDLDGRFDQAFDELVRYASPVISFARTVTRATELGGHLIAEGDKVALFYCSGNRDESNFPEPHLLRLSRPRSEHVAFGGGGVHFCLGSTLARAQVKAILRHTLARLPGLVLGEPAFGFGETVHSVESLPASLP
jgi:cytochrome P450